MFIKQLKIVVAFVLVAVALGASTLAYRAAEPSAPAASKPLSEVEALRKEVELLRLNLLVVLEKVRAQEAELVALRGKGDKEAAIAEEIRRRTLAERVRSRELEALKDREEAAANDKAIRLWKDLLDRERAKAQDPVKQVEAAIAFLRSTSDAAAKKRALEALEAAVKTLREQEGGAPDKAKGSIPGPDPKK